VAYGDRARHWTELATLGGATAGSMSFSDVLHGYVVASKFSDLDDRGVVSETSDGGRSCGRSSCPRRRSCATAWPPFDTVDALALARRRVGVITATAGPGVGERSSCPRQAATQAAQAAVRALRIASAADHAGGSRAKIVVSWRDRPADGWSSETATVDAPDASPR